MASDRQVSANRQNAVKSTGPITQNGKLQSRRNALRHGLTAATVVPAIEDRQEFEQFAAAVRADYQPTSTVEEELISRLTSLLWRLRRSTLIETILFQLQARLAQDQKEATQTGSDTTKPAIEVFYRLLRSPESFVHAQPTSNTPEHINHRADARNARESPSPKFISPNPSSPNPATIFLRLCNLNSFPIERINRYETALWRQVAQTLFILDVCKKRLSSP
jgi:hypothetical protein